MLVSLNKKRAQSREAVISMVKYALNEIYSTLPEDEQMKLLPTLIEVTQGRIFVEYEYSVGIRRLTEIHLKHGDIEAAAKLVQDIQIETFGSLDRAYKVEYILFQMRVLIQKGDYIRVLIVSNKVNRKHLSEEGLEKLKFEFNELMIKYYSHEEKFIEVSKAFKTLFDFTKEMKEKVANSKNEKLEEILKNTNLHFLFVNYVMFLAICPPVLEAKNMFHELNLKYKKDLEENRDMLLIVKKSLSDDIVFLDTHFLSQFGQYPIFDKNIFPGYEKHAKLFRKFWIAHNLGIFGKYFSTVRLARVCTMIGTNLDEVETELADMVINNYIYAKINRIAQTVNFRKRQDTGDKLDDLNHDLTRMLEKLETTCHLIHKENLKYDIK